MGELEDVLKDYILTRYKSIREFTIEANMPYSTVDSIFKRSIRNSSVENVIKICEALGINADELLKGRIVPEQDIPLDELQEIQERLHKTPGMRTLFSLAKDATPEDLKLVEDMLRRMKKNSGFDGPED